VRSVPLFPSVDAALRELAARALERGRYAPEELIFASARGTPLQPSNFRQHVWDRSVRLAGLESEGYRFHDLRHACVSRLVAAADVKLVQAVAGHSNPLITLKRYSHLLDERVTGAAERFDPAHAH
jgi:integrase